MKRTLMPLLTAASALFSAGMTQTSPAEPLVLKTRLDSISYVMGRIIAQGFLKDCDEITRGPLVTGFADEMAGKPLTIEEGHFSVLWSEYENKKQRKIDLEIQEKIKQKQAENQLFLDENKKQPGVKVTASGLQYFVIREGTGKNPQPQDTIKINFRCSQKDGNVLVNTYQDNRPKVCVTQEAPAGVVEAYRMLKPGSHYRFVIPAELCDLQYHNQEIKSHRRPQGPMILVYEIELLEIMPKK